MVVTKDGDLEMYAIYDAPKQSVWSARGDLAFGSGVNLKTIPGLPDNDLDVDIPLSTPGYRLGGNSSELGRGSRSRSARPRDESLIRGRAAKSQSLPPLVPPIVSPALFGRGDEDGFPALPSMTPSAPTGLAATRPQKGRTYSPSALRKYQSHEQGDQQQTGQSSARQPSLTRGDSIPMSGEHGLIGEKLESERARRRPKGREGKNKEVIATIEDDVSMLMRRRAMLGYGLSRVSVSVDFHVRFWRKLIVLEF